MYSVIGRLTESETDGKRTTKVASYIFKFRYTYERRYQYVTDSKLGWVSVNQYYYTYVSDLKDALLTA
jgi:hypothetical protein